MSSAWERDTRSTQGCLICGGPSDRQVRLEFTGHRLGHYLVGPLCSACALAAQAGDFDALSRRSEAKVRRPGQDRAEPELLQALLAWAGHSYELPDEDIEPDEPVEPARVLTDDERATWGEVRQLIEQSPGTAGAFVAIMDHPGDEPAQTIVRCDGARWRVDSVGGRLERLVAGAEQWVRQGERLVRVPVRPHEMFLGSRYRRLWRRRHGPALGDEPVSLRATTYLGRHAWHLGYDDDREVLIDAASGVVLLEVADGATISRCSSLTFDVDLDPDLFVVDEPWSTPEDLQVQYARENEHERARRAIWFDANVAPTPLLVHGRLQVPWLHRWDDDGSFEASIDVDDRPAISLARRPLSADWWALGWSEVQHRWSDEQWDWALTDMSDPEWDEAPLDAASLAELRRVLARGPGSGQPTSSG